MASASSTPLRIALAAGCALALIAPLRAAVAAAAPSDVAAPSDAAEPAASVYGIELETGAGSERVLVFASRPVQHRVDAESRRVLRVRIPRAALDATAPAFVAPGLGRAVTLVRAREDAGDVVLEIHRSPGGAARISSRGSMLAIDFPAPGPGEGPLALQFRDAPIADVVSAIADASGRTYVFDDTLEGRISIAVGAPVDSDRAVELLDAALLLLGHTALPSPGGARVIVPVLGDAQRGPWSAEPLGGSERLVTTLVPLRTARAEEIAEALEPWLGQRAIAVPVSGANALILGGSEAHLQRLMVMLAALDDAAQRTVWLRRLRHRGAEDVKEIVDAWAAEAPAFAAIETWAIPRSETLVALAGARELAALRAFVGRLDVPPRGAGELRALRVVERDADELAELIDAQRSGPGPLSGRDFSVTAYAGTNALLVRGDDETQRLVASLVEELDRAPTLIRLRLQLLEVTASNGLQLALDAFIPFSDPGRSSVNGVLLSPSGNDLAASALRSAFVRAPIAIPIVGADGRPVLAVLPRESAVLTADERAVHTRVLMQPELLMTGDDEHELFSGDEVPVPVASSTPSPVLTTRQAIERRDVGVRLRVRPTATDADIRLELALELSSLAAPSDGPSSLLGPTVRQRRLESTIRLAGEETAVIPLGEEHAQQRREVGVPFLKELPALGWMFRRTEERELTSQLLLMVSATRIGPRAAPEVASLERAMRGDAERRSGALFERLGNPAFALRAARRRRADDARAIADGLAREGTPARVVDESRPGEAAYGIYVGGFDSLLDAARACLALAGRPLLEPEIVARPAPAGAVARVTPPRGSARARARVAASR